MRYATLVVVGEPCALDVHEIDVVHQRVRAPVPRAEREVDAGGAVADEGPHRAEMVPRGEVEVRRSHDDEGRAPGQRHEGLGGAMVPVEVVALEGLAVVGQHVEVEGLAVAELHDHVTVVDHLPEGGDRVGGERFGLHLVGVGPTAVSAGCS